MFSLIRSLLWDIFFSTCGCQLWSFTLDTGESPNSLDDSNPQFCLFVVEFQLSLRYLINKDVSFKIHRCVFLQLILGRIHRSFSEEFFLGIWLSYRTCVANGHFFIIIPRKKHNLPLNLGKPPGGRVFFDVIQIRLAKK